MRTNNVTRLLQSQNIPFTVFELPAEKHSALETAGLLNVAPEIVFKTIVATREKGAKTILVVIPAPNEVNLKKLADLLSEKKIHLPTQREAEQLTQLQAGGISPLSLINKGFLVVLDQIALQYEQIHISGGERGLNIRLPVTDLIRLTKARTADVSTPIVRSFIPDA
jgi:Cys-tRNA(Pro)/Cys-tRNA(Cys) deacylase